MNRSWWLRFGLLVFFIVVAFVHVFPTLANLNLETTKFPFKKKVNLGLDLQGGLYMVYGVDFKKVYSETVIRAVDSVIGQLEKEKVTVYFLLLLTRMRMFPLLVHLLLDLCIQINF